MSAYGRFITCTALALAIAGCAQNKEKIYVFYDLGEVARAADAYRNPKMQIADLDGDGKQDVILSCPDGSRRKIFLNRTE